jgi:hypothetical protein
VAVVQSGILSGKTITAISAGSSHSLALCSDGTLAAWGSGSSGQLGNNSANSSIVPVAVVQNGVLSGKVVIGISAGGSHNLALCSDGTVAAWGLGASGQLGNNSTSGSNVPVAVVQSGVLSGKTIKAMGTGFSHSLALCSDGTLAAWGSGSSGQLGNNGTSISLVPVLVSTSGLAAGEYFIMESNSASANHTLALIASPPSPATLTLAATSITSTSVILNGLVNANNNATTVSFDYGTTASYGTNVAGTPTPVTGSGATSVNTTLMGLNPGTTYHFRVSGANNAGTTSGTDLTFTTLTDLQNWRRIYFGTPANSGNAADTFDFSRNGLPNLVKYSFGLDPTDVTARQLPQLLLDGDALTTSFNTPAGVSGITYGAEWTESLDPANWQPVPDTGTGATHIFSMPVAGRPSLFLRLKVSVP